MKRILVTGGAGFIGSNFIRHILKERLEWDVTNLDKLSYAGSIENCRDFDNSSHYQFVRGDIADAQFIDGLLSRYQFDVLVNFAAESHVDRSIMDSSPFIETNVNGVRVLLDAVRSHGILRFIQISTDEVYGSIGAGKFTEETPLQPSSPYAASKTAGDVFCRAYHKTYGAPVIITRSSNNYGPYQFPEKLIPLIIDNAVQGKSIPIYGNGENIRDWLYVEDNCRAIALIVEKGRLGEVYNIGGDGERSNIEIVKMICEFLALRLQKPKSEFEKLITFVKDRPGHDFRYSIDHRKTEKEFGWSPRLSLKKGLEMTVGWYLDHREWLRKTVS